MLVQLPGRSDPQIYPHEFLKTQDPEHSILKAIDQPVLIASGSHDTMLPAENAHLMFKLLKNAQLIIYPDSGHGVLFQYPKLFVDHVELFLND